MTITEFLLARIAEDEAAARSLDAELAKEFGSTEAQLSSELSLAGSGYMDYPVLTVDSTRVLAECQAKRVAVDWYLNDDATVMEATIRALAAVNADHPDYREEWRP